MFITREEAEVAKEIGINATIVVSRIDYWLHAKSNDGKRWGKVIDGVRYVHNTYEEWQEQFPWLTTRGLKKIFKKLVDDGILLRTKYYTGKHSWNQARGWSIDYSHPIGNLVHYAQGTKGTIDREQSVRSYNYNTYPNKTANTTRVVETHTPSDKNPYHNRTRSKWKLVRDKVSPEEKAAHFKQAEAWRSGLGSIYQDRVDSYIKTQMSSPKINNPIGYEREVLIQVWYKHIGMPNHCDFVVTRGVNQVQAPSIKLSPPKNEYELQGADITPDEEMELLLQQGDLDYG